jgi:branched-chain amino acid transport system ATP-binding protein
MTYEVDGAWVEYQRGVPILRGVSLHVDAGEVVAVLGPNGSGKSTLLKAMIGILRAASGQVRLEGRSIGHLAAHTRARKLGIAYVPQTENVFGPLSVRDNLLLAAQALPRVQRSPGVERVLSDFPILSDRWRQRSDLLSGGERQMLALGRALMTEPRYLLIDEPTAGLAPGVAKEVLNTLRVLRREKDLGLLLVEQNVRQALSISDRAYVLVQGEVKLTGTGTELLADQGIAEMYLGGTLQEETVASGSGEVEGR